MIVSTCTPLNEFSHYDLILNSERFQSPSHEEAGSSLAALPLPATSFSGTGDAVTLL